MTPNRRTVMASLPVIGMASTLAAPVAAATAPASNSPRQRLRLDDDWRFHFGHAEDLERDFGFGANQRTLAKQGRSGAKPDAADYDDSTWRSVILPHDWAVELPFVNNEDYRRNPADKDDEDYAAAHGYKPIGRKFPETSVGWYRRLITLDKADAGRCLWLEFDGVFRDATIIFNGYILERHDSGYTSFRVDISDFINTDDTPNVLLVRVDASYGEGWFYEGAGIYRHVWLVKADPVHVPQWGVFVRPQTNGTVEATVDLVNRSETPRVATLEVTALDKDGTAVATTRQTVDLTAQSAATREVRLTLPQPRLWSIDSPYLYTLRVEVTTEATRDLYTLRFGLRDLRFDAREGFFLNGKPVKIKGTNNHQDHAGVGAAIPDALQVWRLKQLKSLGSNAYRTSHNPPTPELLDACDELGLLVIDEVRQMTSSRQGLSELEALIRRDRNHPSVILWSIGNEEPQQMTARGLKVAKSMARRIRELDPTRKVNAAMNKGFGDGITTALDVIGFNYHEAQIEPFRARFPDMPIIGTETASAVSTRGEYKTDAKRQVVASYDTEHPYWGATAETWWSLYNSKPYLLGGFIWTGFDYRGEPTPFNWWPSVASNFGVFDSCGFPKDIYHYYRAWWQDETVLHLLPHWNWSEGETVQVWAYSNCDEVELFLNRKSLGRQTMRRDSHLEWTVPFTPGTLTAYGYKGGKVVMKTERKTAGAPHLLVLSADRTQLSADGLDVAMISVSAVDKAGVTVPLADDLIQFALTGQGRVIGVGNGNPNSHEPDKATYRRLFNGYAQAIVQTTRTGGRFTFEARAEGLTAASLTFTSR